MIYTGKYQSPLGEMTMAGDEGGLTGLWFDGQKYYASTLPKECEQQEIAVFADTRKWLDIYFTGKAPEFIPKLHAEGTAFRKKVWDILLEIPYGQTITYGEIASRIAAEKGLKRMSAQAVGGAVGHNPISLIVPCHRVIGSNGSLTGYAGGIKLKKELLELEKGK